jgi:hypothetical protein
MNLVRDLPSGIITYGPMKHFTSPLDGSFAMKYSVFQYMKSFLLTQFGANAGYWIYKPFVKGVQ